MKIAIVVGTRPEVIKMAPIIKECQAKNLEFILIHSNQHYSSEMDEIFFKEMELPEPNYNLNVGSATHSNQIGNILIKIEPILRDENPSVVLVQGDTNTVSASAMAASKLQIPLAHIEAGLRSYDRTMPEETNRVVTDHMSDFLFAVTEKQQGILLKEGISSDKIFVVGNTIADAVKSNRELASRKSTIISDLKLKQNEYVLFTAHRAANVDSKNELEKLLSLIDSIPEKVVWPIHLRTKAKLMEHSLDLPANVIAASPLGYIDFLNLISNSKIVITDSGGVQEEACILGVPCLTIRENTERPETIEVGANKIIGLDKIKLQKGYKEFTSNNPASWTNPFGDGDTAKKVISILMEKIGGKLSSMRLFSINVIGMGYMGLPMACLLSESGHKVLGVDINKEKLKTLGEGKCPFEEPGLGELFERTYKRLEFSEKPRESDIFVIATPTPQKNKKCDLDYVKAALKSVIPFLKPGTLIIIESTVKPRACEDVLLPMLGDLADKVLFAHCPERAIPGNTLFELSNNDRIIGANTEEAKSLAEEVYNSFIKGKIFKTDLTTAECVKLVENTSRDLNIAFANELSEILTFYGTNPFEVIALANKHPRVEILQPGPGVGGHCIAVDPWFLCEDYEEANLIKLARKINDERPKKVVDHFVINFPNAKKVGILGVAYKKNVDDCRETPAKYIFELLQAKNFEVKAFDPHVNHWDYELASKEEIIEWADSFILVTDHDEFRQFNGLKNKILDTRNLMSPL